MTIIKEYSNGEYKTEDKLAISEIMLEMSSLYHKKMSEFNANSKPKPQDLFDLGISVLMTVSLNGLGMLHDAFDTNDEERMKDIESFCKKLTKGYQAILNDKEKD